MVEMSRIPDRDMCRVRGMGVAVIVKQSISLRKFFIFSLCSTPKRCSSSSTRSPSSLNLTSPESRRWVPMTKSIFPSLKSRRIFSCSLGELKRLSAATRTPKSAKRPHAVLKC